MGAKQKLWIRKEPRTTSHAFAPPSIRGRVSITWIVVDRERDGGVVGQSRLVGEDVDEEGPSSATEIMVSVRVAVANGTGVSMI